MLRAAAPEIAVDIAQTWLSRSFWRPPIRRAGTFFLLPGYVPYLVFIGMCSYRVSHSALYLRGYVTGRSIYTAQATRILMLTLHDILFTMRKLHSRVVMISCRENLVMCRSYIVVRGRCRTCIIECLQKTHSRQQLEGGVSRMSVPSQL